MIKVASKEKVFYGGGWNKIHYAQNKKVTLCKKNINPFDWEFIKNDLISVDCKICLRNINKFKEVLK